MVTLSEKLIEQGFGWAKTVGRIRQVMVRGLERVDQMFVLTMSLTLMTPLARQDCKLHTSSTRAWAGRTNRTTSGPFVLSAMRVRQIRR